MLDLCCGKGGDLLKWQRGRIKKLVCAGQDNRISHSQETQSQISLKSTQFPTGPRAASCEILASYL